VSGDQLGALLPLVLIALVFYLLIIRPARRRAQVTNQLQSSLSAGDEVMLTSGLFATIVDVQDEIAQVELAPGILVRVHRKAVGQIIHDLPPAPGDPEYDAPSPADEPGDENPGVN
jgi:preprotein translocase subunit YajC